MRTVLTFKFRYAVVEIMKTFFRTALLGSLLAVSVNSYALSESEAEDMADLTAVFVFLKNDCGYNNLPNGRSAVRWYFSPSKTSGISATMMHGT